ncbi:hypothetical protein KFK09_026381 [Dendrobium nobile]|uniref:Uncharacterized protein n=1 Tax=Dendrobium nobile TaxID=94219 RepID=A0A8T3A6E0_DENNO|nr:hypothetical protein KFK09_026381 [Dendrobium nobile]
MRIGSYVVGKEDISIVGCDGIMIKHVVGVLVSFMKIMEILFVHGGFIPPPSFKEVKVMFQENSVLNTGIIAVLWLPLSGSSKDDCLVVWIFQGSLGLSECSVDGLKWDSISPKQMDFIVLYFEVQGLLIVGFLEVEISDIGVEKAKRCLWFYTASDSAFEFLCQKNVNRAFPSEDEFVLWPLWNEVRRRDRLFAFSGKKMLEHDEETFARKYGFGASLGLVFVIVVFIFNFSGLCFYFVFFLGLVCFFGTIVVLYEILTIFHFFSFGNSGILTNLLGCLNIWYPHHPNRFKMGSSRSHIHYESFKWLTLSFAF